ncbi:CHAT domain-containing protein [Mycena vitilis]|nr:CHAT domain-containing protein [Mycena vitilis]
MRFRIIHIHSIRVNSLVHPHTDISSDMQMLAHLIIDGNIVKQSDTVMPEASGISWKLKFDCKIPSDALVFSLAVLRKNLPSGSRLLAHAEIARGEALTLGEQKKPLILQLIKVDPDGPSFEIRAGFSVSESTIESRPNDLDSIRLGPLDSRAIVQSLESMSSFADKNRGPMPAYAELEAMHERILLLPITSQYRARFLNALGAIGVECYRGRNALNDLHHAIWAHTDAVRDNSAVAAHLADLGVALWERFQRVADVLDIDKSVELLTRASDISPNEYSIMISLGNSLQTRFQRLGNLEDLSEAIAMLKHALRCMPRSDDLEATTNRGRCLNNLGGALTARFNRLGNLGDINESLLALKKALDLLPATDKPSCLTNIGNSLQHRFERLGDLSDINHAVSALTQAVRSSTSDDKKFLILAVLGDCLQMRFDRLGNLDDLNKTVEVTKEAVNQCPRDHPRRFSCLKCLGGALQRRFGRLHDVNDIHEAVVVFKDASGLVTNDNPAKVEALAHLGQAQLHLFLRVENLSDLNDAILALSSALRLCPDGYPFRAAQMGVLAFAIFTRFIRRGDDNDCERAIALAAEAAYTEAGPTTLRFTAALNWAQMLQHRTMIKSLPHFADHESFDDSKMQQHWQNLLSQPEEQARLMLQFCSEAIPAYTAALQLLPELSWLGLSISDRHHHIGTPARFIAGHTAVRDAIDSSRYAKAVDRNFTAGRVVRDAVGAAIGAQEYAKAVEWLEQGRSIVWGQISELRSPVVALRQSHPDLADNFLLLSNELERAGTRKTTVPPHNPSADGGQWTFEGQEYHEAALSREMLLKEIRALDKFDGFLLPKTISELAAAAQRGPVVVLVVCAWEVSALVLMPGLDNDVLHIPLPDFGRLSLSAAEESLKRLLPGHGRGERLAGRRQGQMPPEAEFEHVLAELWKRVAWPVLQGLGYTSPPKNPQRIWWCLTGPLTFIPIHAAGLYGEDDGFGSKLSDFVISSYTPSLNALIEAFRCQAHPREVQLLAVAQPSAHGQSYIPGTKKELDDLQELAQATEPKISLLRFDGNAATVEIVRQGMRESGWVHFACHGIQSATNPTESALLLSGSSRLTLSEIIELNLPHADFAFLSACQTATGAKNLEEEAVHLAAGMMSAGYRSVIATMWSIMDEDAPNVAADVYAHLFKTSPPDPTRAAEALHLAVRKLQHGEGEKKSFFHWVPFIHVGA